MPAGGGIIFPGLQGIAEDDPGEFPGDPRVLSRRSQKFRHEGQVYPPTLAQGHGQGFTGRIHRRDLPLGSDGALGEKIRLALQLPVLIQHLQGAEEIIAGVVGKGQAVGLVVDQAEVGGKGIVEGIKLLLGGLDLPVSAVLHLQVNQMVDAVPQFHHGLDPGFGRGAQLGTHHAAVLPVVNFSVRNRKRVILYGWVGGNGVIHCLAVPQVRERRLLVIALDVLHGLPELVGQGDALQGADGSLFPAILGTLPGQLSQHHLGMLHKVAVDGNAVLG